MKPTGWNMARGWNMYTTLRGRKQEARDPVLLFLFYTSYTVYYGCQGPEAKYPHIDQFFNSSTAPVFGQGLGRRGPMVEEYKMLEIILNDQQYNGSCYSGTEIGGRMAGWEY